MVIIKNGWGLLDHRTVKSGVSHKWFENRIDWMNGFLYADSNWIIFGLTTNLLCVLDIYGLSTAVLLNNNILFLVRTGKVLELAFPNAFNKNLGKCGKIVSCQMQYLKEDGKWPET